MYCPSAVIASCVVRSSGRAPAANGTRWIAPVTMSFTNRSGLLSSSPGVKAASLVKAT
jgi:hypothetical protein